MRRLYNIKITFKNGENISMKIVIGTYVNGTIKELSQYKRIPRWVTDVLHSAAVHSINVPENIIICPHISHKTTHIYGAYLYKGKRSDTGVEEIADVITLFTYKLDYNMCKYAFAHEIGHCDHWKRNIIMGTTQDAEDYANRIAEKLTGLSITNDESLD